jgi:hypothetical protein
MKVPSAIAFGDSFINIFSTIKNKDFKIYKLTGATVKGLINKNENYTQIINLLNTNYYTYGFFNFGFVDVNFYYFYKKYKNNIHPEFNFDNILKYIDDYVCFIKSLKNIKYKIILSIIPNPVKEKYIKNTFLYYKVLNSTEIESIDNNDLNEKVMFERTMMFNNYLSKSCLEHQIKFINFSEKISTNNSINSLFKLAHNKSNIHVNFEYILIYLLNNDLKFLTNFYDYEQIIQTAKQNYDKYLYSALKKHNKIELFDKYKFNYDKLQKFF